MTSRPGAPRAVRPFGVELTPRVRVAIDADERDRLTAIAGAIRSAEPELGHLPPSGDVPVDLAPGLTDGPRFVVEDHREIPLCAGMDPPLEQRMMLLARDGDLVGVSDREGTAFEEYCRRDLRIGAVEVRRLRGTFGTPLPVRAATDPVVMDELVSTARRAGRLDLVPFISTPSVWALARQIALAGPTVRVAGPPPALAGRVNDKLWFAAHARRIVGEGAVPTTWPATDADELIGRLRDAARSHERLVVKVPASAGGRGIVRLDGERVRSAPAHVVADEIGRRLAADGWAGEFPLLVEIWEEHVVASPSVQTWIPPLGDGDPIVYGLFEQQLEHGFRFAGTITSALPAARHEELATDAMRLAVCYQQLGYVGPCSFDGLLVGRGADEAAVRWIECNGRWTSTSLAHHVAHRLSGGTARAIAVVQQRRLSTAADLGEVIARLGADAFHRRDDGQGVVVMAARQADRGVFPCLLVVGRTRDDVGALARDLVARFHPDTTDGGPTDAAPAGGAQAGAAMSAAPG